MSFLWEEPGGVERHGIGVTRDVSQIGVFIQSDTQAPLASVVRFELDFHDLVTGNLHMMAQGRVLRVEPSQSGEMGGFVVTTKSLHLKIIDTKG